MISLGQLTLDSSFDAVGEALIGECHRRGYSRDETIGVVADGVQESWLRPRAHNAAGPWDGIFQQDASYPDRFDANGQIRGFLDRLDVKRRHPGHGDIWLNIFWLQQRPSDPSAAVAYAKGRKAYLTEIQSRTDEATRLVDRYWPDSEGGTPVPTTWTGDPVWLADVVKPAVDRFAALPGWDSAGHGDFKDLRGVMVHHTGNARESAQSIRNGRPDLAGPLANFHIAPDGTVTLVAVGVCWHAGAGSYPWLPTNMANWHMIGIECAYPFDTTLTAATAYREPWPRAQIIALRNTVAAILLRGNLGPDRVIGHKDYAGRAQGKWDPGNMAVVGWLQDEVRKDMEGFVFPGETGPRPVPVVTAPPIPAPIPAPDNYADVLIHRGMTGLPVIKLQTRLQRNYSKLVVDGVYGPRTEDCVRDYQRLHPPLAADGVVGPLTAASLGLVI